MVEGMDEMGANRTRKTTQGRPGSIRSASARVGVEMEHQTRAGPAVETMSTKGMQGSEQTMVWLVVVSLKRKAGRLTGGVLGE